MKRMVEAWKWSRGRFGEQDWREWASSLPQIMFLRECNSLIGLNKSIKKSIVQIIQL